MTPPNESPGGALDPLVERLLNARQDEKLLTELEQRIRAAQDDSSADPGARGPSRRAAPSVRRARRFPIERRSGPRTRSGRWGSDPNWGVPCSIGHVGCGGMGTVYKAVLANSSVPDVHYAIKVLKPETPIPEADRKFQHEAELLSKLAYQDHIVPLFQTLIDPATGVHFLVMPLINGSSLADHLAKKNGEPSPWPWAADVIRQVARGLAVINERLPRLVHGDLKPGNILLGASPLHDTPLGVRALIADFGPRHHPNSPPRQEITVTVRDGPLFFARIHRRSRLGHGAE